MLGKFREILGLNLSYQAAVGKELRRRHRDGSLERAEVAVAVGVDGGVERRGRRHVVGVVLGLGGGVVALLLREGVAVGVRVAVEQEVGRAGALEWGSWNRKEYIVRIDKSLP